MENLPPIPEGFTRCIAARAYELVSASGTLAVWVEVGEPIQDVPTVAGLDWRCPVKINYGEHILERQALGVDSFQCLYLAMAVLIPNELEAMAEQAGGKVLWLGQELGVVELAMY